MLNDCVNDIIHWFNNFVINILYFVNMGDFIAWTTMVNTAKIIINVDLVRE